MNTVYTIGYEGTDIDRFIATLTVVGVKQLVDVRAVTVSRKKGFSKNSLASRLCEAGIQYVHFVSLGDPKDGRDAARAGQYERFQQVYRNHFRSPEAQSSFNDLLEVAAEAPTCLLCFEREPKVCHRSIVAEEMISSGFEIFDLFGDDPDRYVRNAEKLPRSRSS